MAERFVCQQVPAGDARLTAAGEPEETLVQDVRADLTPAQMVDTTASPVACEGCLEAARSRARSGPAG
jgi:hypothetical protein